jgi:predicted ATPase
MLKRVHIKGFRSCQDVLIDDIGSMTALVGRNGSGKTNILRAIDWLARTATASDLGADEIDQSALFSGSIEIDIEQDGSIYRYTFGIHQEKATEWKRRFHNPLILKESIAIRKTENKWDTLLDRDGPGVHIVGRREPIRIGLSAPCLPFLASQLPDTDDIIPHVHRLLFFLRDTHYYPFDEMSEPSDIDNLTFVFESRYQQWLSRSRSSRQENNSVLFRLFDAYREKKARFREILSLVGDTGLGLIQDITVQRIPPLSEDSEENESSNDDIFYLMRFRVGRLLGGGSRSYSYHDLSLGTRRVLRIITALVMDECTLMLIEHPEDAIHPGLLKKLIDILHANADPAQIILSSHSAEVFNRLRAQDVRLVSIHRGATTVRSLTRKEASAAARFVRDDGSLADFLETVQGG